MLKTIDDASMKKNKMTINEVTGDSVIDEDKKPINYKKIFWSLFRDGGINS